MPEICLGNQELEVVEEIQILGQIMRSDMRYGEKKLKRDYGCEND